MAQQEKISLVAKDLPAELYFKIVELKGRFQAKSWRDFFEIIVEKFE